MPQTPPADARVFAVASGKGGVGKTTTAVNVGAALAASGAETVVVDADLGMANVADLLDLSISGPTLQDVLADEYPVEKATYRTHAGMAVVPGATDLDAYAEVDPERLRTVVESLRAEFEYVFLDAGAGLSHDSALPLGLADAVVLVTTPRETAARDAGKTREVAERIDAAVGGVVVTRVREEPSELDPDAIAERVGASVLAAVPEDGAVREALAAGRPAVVHDPEGRVTTAYRRLAAALTGREAVEPVAEATDAPDADDATSLAELLEREADRPDDVSALTGDATPGTDESTPDETVGPTPEETDDPTPDATDEPSPDATDDDSPDPADEPSPADDPLTPNLDGEQSDDVGADGEPSDPLEAPTDEGEAPIDGDDSPGAESSSSPSADEDDSPVAADTDGDILIAEEAPLDDAGDSVGGRGDNGVGSDDAAPMEEPSDSDPMADIPRFDDESAEEFTRGSEAADALAADPLAAGPADGAVAPADGEDGMGTDEGDEIGTGGDERDPGVEDEPDARDEPDEAGVAAGPRVELDEEDPDASGGSGLLGRLAGLFR